MVRRIDLNGTEDCWDHNPLLESPSLHIVDGKIIVVALGKELEFVMRSHLRLNGDEKPLIPDSPVISGWNISDLKNNPIATGRSNSWTLHFYMRATGDVLPPLLILRGESVECEIVSLFNEDNGVVRLLQVVINLMIPFTMTWKEF